MNTACLSYPEIFDDDAALDDTRSSTTTDPDTESDPDNDTDADDNGPGHAFPVPGAITSNPITLGPDDEPEGENLGPEGHGTPDDNNSNLTLDFGFVPLLSLGNRVWFDQNNDGIMNTDEWNDANENDIIDAGEFPDVNGNGTPDQSEWDDIDGDGVVDAGEWTDLDSDGTIDAIEWTDLNQDGNLDPGEWNDLDGDGVVDYIEIQDADHNGRFDSSEEGISGVRVNLLYSDGTQVIDPATGNPMFDTTDANGYYLFENLLAGDYIVQIDGANFSASGDLVGYRSSTSTEANPNVDMDNTDNGIDDADPANNGIQSGVVTLAQALEPVDESSADSVDADDDGDADDDNANLTIDFGFHKVLSLGNRVWLDTGTGAGENNNGDEDASEVDEGVENVTVNLYAADGTTLLDSTITDATGYYLFDLLASGEYVVEIPALNFVSGRPLYGYYSSSPTELSPDGDLDRNDNGLNDPNPELNGIRSGLVTLESDSEPLTEIEGAQGRGSVEGDNDSNLSLDFGFTQTQSVSLGNRVWLDNGADGGTADNGIMDGGEVGIEGVTLELRDASNNLVATDTTDADGYYLFDSLQPGDYTVTIPESNFQAGTPDGPLYNLRSSTGEEADPNNNNYDSPVAANNDNGQGHALEPGSSGGVSSATITLAADDEPINDDDLGPEQHGGVDDDNSNLSIDFGFVPKLALGNRIWYDTDNDGEFDADESGVEAGITVNLLDSGGNTITTATTAGGYYLFENLPPGDYIVEIPSTEFESGDTLHKHLSSSPTESDPDADNDNNDNGLNDTIPETGGIRSGVVTLSDDGEPTSETSTGSGSADNDGDANDNDSNLSVDFGLVPGVSLGNRIWIDDDFDGVFDAGEVGDNLSGIIVNLLDSSGNPARDGNGNAITTTTDADGYYRFDNLYPGDYIVEIDADNFQPGSVLEGYSSSGPTVLDPDDASGGTDNDDNASTTRIPRSTASAAAS